MKKSKPVESAEALAPKVGSKRRRTDRKYEVKSQAHGDIMDKGVKAGDTSAIPPVEDWRAVSDKVVMLRGRQTMIKAGLVVNRLTHDLDNLKTQGVVLQRVL